MAGCLKLPDIKDLKATSFEALIQSLCFLLHDIQFFYILQDPPPVWKLLSNLLCKVHKYMSYMSESFNIAVANFAWQFRQDLISLLSFRY